jgi:hypothetical protein
MKLSFLLMFIYNGVSKFTTKIISMPIYNSCNLLNLHHVVVFENKHVLNDENLLQPIGYYNVNIHSIYMIDYSPSDSINNLSTISKLLIGNNCNGKIRIYHFQKLNNEFSITSNQNLINLWNDKIRNYNQHTINYLDKDVYDIIMKWNTSFNLYNHNCRHFSNYFVKSISKL